MPRYFSLKDVAEHGTVEAPWFIIDNKVYDVTKLLAEHPGGDKVLLEFAGKDATGGFFGRNHSDSAKKWMKDFEIGELENQTKPWWKSPLYIAAGVAVVAVTAVVVIKIVKNHRQ